MDRSKLNLDKIRELPTTNKLIDNQFGEIGTLTRDTFTDEALSWYFGELIKSRRKEKKLTQQQLADKIGKERSYIAKIEQGKTDLQLSNFVKIINALSLKLTLS